MVKAVVDVGSNSVLLLVSQRTEQGWQTLLETSAVTGLGQGTKSSGLLSERGMTMTLEALASAFSQAKKYGAEYIEAWATMAARIASNTSEFLDRAIQQGTPVSVLSGDQEAQLGFESVANDPLFATEPVLSIIDIGGHSTEIVTAKRNVVDWTINFRKSFSIGALGLRERALLDDKPSFRERLQAVEEIDDTFATRYLPHSAGRAVTLGATGTNLVSIRNRSTTWSPDEVHGQELEFEEVSKAVSQLCDLGDAGRANVIGIEPGREHTLHAGALILERSLHMLGVLSCTVSIRGWRHALLEGIDL